MFYELKQWPQTDAQVQVSMALPRNLGDAKVCRRCGNTISFLAWLPPYRVNLKRFGREFGDFAFFSAASEFLVSGRFRSLYRKSGMTGLLGFNRVTVTSVQSRRRNRPKMPTYYKVHVYYGKPALDLAASECEWEHTPTCNECRTDLIKRWARIVIEEGTWSGEDVFEPRGLPGSIVVTERFKRFCDTNAITNAQFVPADQAGKDFYPWEKKRTPRRGTGKSKRKAK